VIRRRLGAFTVAVLVSLGSTLFAVEPGHEFPPPEYFAGEYELIGRSPDSKTSYAGTLRLHSEVGGRFAMIRNIGGQEIKGSAKLDHADPPGDRPAILRISFRENGKDFEGTFLWQSDFDNRARMTGFIYRLEKGKRLPARLEAWFAMAHS
jgi:hypothetical protein